MRWTSLCLLAVLLAASAPSEEKRMSIYSTIAGYNLPVADREGREYVGLLEILEPLGTVSSRQDRDRWKLRFNNLEAEFRVGRDRAKVQGREVDLTAPFLLENGRGLVPLGCLTSLLARFLGGPVSFHENSRRLFIGNVAVHFTAQITKTTPPALVMEFTSRVNPSIATEPGRLLMRFTREPLVAPGTNTLTFGDKAIPSATYSEANGAAEVSINSALPLLATFSNDGRRITLAPAPQPGAPSQPAMSLPTVQAPAAPTPSLPPGRRWFAVVDASHGGDERGAALTDQLAEKDVTLALARLLRQELENRGLPAVLVRDSDVTLTTDQRAAQANAAHPSIYVSIHAASQGPGVRVYTAVMPPANGSRGVFLDWDAAQLPVLALSQTAAAGVVAELQKKQIPMRLLSAPLRPLNNLTMPALAIEVALPDSNTPAYQQAVAAAVATGLAAAREKLEAGR